MSCPRSLWPSGMHSWLQYTDQGKPKGWWRCQQCGKRRRRRARTGFLRGG